MFISLVYLGYLAVIIWFGVKLFWWLRFDVPMTGAPNVDTVWETYYPELWSSGAIDSQPATDDDQLDVLLLGGSVLEQVAKSFETELRKVCARPVRVYSLAISAHTSRDSRNKLRRLREKPFDGIVFYHGINDVRMNYCPTADFRGDYSHCAWYATFEERVRLGRMTVRDIIVDRVDRISLGPPTAENLEYGHELKTPSAFRDNLETIVAASQRPGQRVILATFAYHLPADYTRERFENHELDYGRGSYELAAELWGQPDDVAAAIDAHNQQVHDVAARYSNTTLVDLAHELPRNDEVFSDLCHLTPRGCELFVACLLETVQPLWAGKGGQGRVSTGQQEKVKEDLVKQEAAP